MTSAKSQAIGCFFAIVQAVFYSTMGIFGKLLYATGLGAQEVVILRFLDSNAASLDACASHCARAIGCAERSRGPSCAWIGP